MDDDSLQSFIPATPSNIRPYRSHRYPACDCCRNRKIKCNVDLPGRACRFCRERQEVCNYAPKDTALLSDPASVLQPQPRPSKRPRRSHNHADEGISTSRSSAGAALSQFPSVIGTSPTESSLIMDPYMSEDIAILEHYLTSPAAEGSAAARLYNTISTAPSNPIIYLTVPRRRKGLKSGLDPGRTQRDIIEQVLSPVASEVRKLYFDHFHPCFPILDEKTFAFMWQRDNQRISSALICDIYASALPSWECSKVLQSYPRPDAYFIWNQAVAALQEDFMAPTISTIHAALLDITGRPVIHATGNIVNAGRVVTLAQSLGLHRDPMSWKATADEKSVRIRLWWGVLVHDYWSSISHGIPPTINPRYYDVPLPGSEILATSSASDTQKKANTSFIHLCKLSQILGDILPYVYSLQFDVEEVARGLRKIECSLDDWLVGLPDCLQLNSIAVTTINGSSNLWFAYLSVKVLVCRIAYKATLRDPKPSSSETRQYRQAILRDASSDVADFVTSLTEAQLREFWMPYTSYLLVTATTVLLRCIIECGAMETKKLCATKLVKLIDRLQSASEISNWDLAEFCLERCREPIQKIADALKISTRTARDQNMETETASTLQEATYDYLVGPAADDSSSMSDVFLRIDSIDYPWEALWDTIDGPWPMQI